MQLRVDSVNVGLSKPLILGNRTVSSAIVKAPVAGPVEVAWDGLAGDEQGDKRSHGGADQAVYLYSAEDYAWWADRLGFELAPATFGENLTLSSFGAGPVRVGDRFRIGGVLLEATGPRIPCGKLATRMGDPGFAKRFREAGRPGVYTRVLSAGWLEAGARVERLAGSESAPTVPEVMRLYLDKEPDPAELRQALAAPLAERTRAALERQLDRVG